ncbi:hypothetical protein SCALIN_C10_0015 [Candidatus Scalindua japonica]|uniref:Uncharacterized protein TP-0789 domain-containing protein n=1 Tax=Candidatus Scalindua japonica TaxID=1284222 RepID=A0A286TWL1_9BACT|nr:outer membrane lipoprotein-sorting protein [Candidatus Scalindua japonica]GAX60255.1 hypothetical protein SCALIN_C10_0015 [Candidatus Scalindua japonica]
MKMIRLLYYVLALLVCCRATHADMTGREIMEKQKDQHELQSEKTVVQMTLENKKGKIKERQIVNYVLKEDTGLNKIMIKFKAPADIKNVGLLTWEQGADREDDQWLYLPALKKVKRIATSGKKNKFMGTDYAYEDLRPENLVVHNYELKGAQTIDDHDCYVIEAVPSTENEKKNSGYSKRLLYIRKDILYTIKSEYINKKGKMFKILTTDELVNVKGNIWRAEKSIMKDIKAKHSTRWNIIERDITTLLDKHFFTQRNLKKP